MEIDEKFVKKEGDGYANVWIRQSEMTGRVADVYPEGSDQFPMTWEQTRGVIMELLQIQDPYITSVLQSPENVDEFSKIFSLTKFKVPGAEQRYKQIYEIAKLKQGQPVQVSPAPAEGLVRLFSKSGQFIGVGQVLDDGRIGPKRLMQQKPKN